MISFQITRLPAHKRISGGTTSRTVRELIVFLSHCDPDAPIGAWCHNSEGANYLGGLGLSLAGVERRICNGISPGNYGHEVVQFAVSVTPIEDLMDDQE